MHVHVFIYLFIFSTGQKNSFLMLLWQRVGVEVALSDGEKRQTLAQC